VHQAADGKLAVVGVMFKEGAPNELFNMFVSQFPQPMTTFSSPVAIDLGSLLPKSQRYYQYMGSLTTPSCAETVTWHILTSPVTASKEQIKAFKHILHNNVRPLQPLNGRVVRLSMNVVPG
jgi:carbonic anhydrase